MEMDMDMGTDTDMDMDMEMLTKTINKFRRSIVWKNNNNTWELNNQVSKL